MEAIILAGGFGTRLRPFTYTRAKSLLPILNQPMVSYLMNMLPNEVDKVILAVNYRKDQIEDFFARNSFDKEIIVNDEPEPLGTGGAVKFAEKHITGSFFVLNSDIISSLNMSKMMFFHKQHNAIASISLWPVEDVSEFGVVDIHDDKIVGFVEKPKPEDAPSNLINAGAYLLEPEVLDYIETGRLVSMEKEIFPQIISDTDRFYGYQISDYWIDVGRIRSYIDVHTLLLKQYHKPVHQGDQTVIHGLVTNSSLGNHVFIDKNTKIMESVVLDNTKIHENVRCESSVIGENCVIGANSSLKYVAIGDNEIIPPNTHLDNKIIWTQAIPSNYPKKQIGNVIGE